MAVEGKRGCGFRKVGGLYLVGTGIAVGCHRLPFPLHVCPTCGAGIKFSRGFTWIKPRDLFGLCFGSEIGDNRNLGGPDVCTCGPNCPMCSPDIEPAGLMWVGEKYYTPDSFIEEGVKMGISKRIASLAREFKLGATWVYLAHKKAIPVQKRLLPGENGTAEKGEKATSAIFYAFRPTRIEKILTESQATDEEKEKLAKRGITPVIVPDDDLDHNPKGEN